MKKADAIRHYGSVRRLADALGITYQAIYQWGEDVPESSAYKLQVLTGGALSARDEPKDEG